MDRPQVLSKDQGTTGSTRRALAGPGGGPVSHRSAIQACLTVHDQKACGWCVAHATTAFLEAAACAQGHWNKNVKLHISEPHLWYLGDPNKFSNGFTECESGWATQSAFETIAAATSEGNYIVNSDLWPFDAVVDKMNKKMPSTDQLKQTGYWGGAKVLKVPGKDVQALKSALATGNNVVYSLPVYKDTGWACRKINTNGKCTQKSWGMIHAPWQAPKNDCSCSCEKNADGSLKDKNCDVCEKEPHCVLGYHAVLITGYDDSGVGWFEFLNSWGTAWADKGFGKLAYDLIKSHGQDGYYLKKIMTNPKPPVADIAAPPIDLDAGGPKWDANSSPDIGPAQDVTFQPDSSSGGYCGIEVFYAGKSQWTCGGGFTNCLNFYNGFKNCVCSGSTNYTACVSMLSGGYSDSDCNSGNYTKAQLISKMNSHLATSSSGKWSLKSFGNCSGIPKKSN